MRYERKREGVSPHRGMKEEVMNERAESEARSATVNLSNLRPRPVSCMHITSN